MLVLCVFSIQRFEILVSRFNPQITQNLVTDAFDSKFNTTFDDIGFKFAWAVLDHSTLEAKDDPKYVMF
jgi:hypothetical protein